MIYLSNIPQSISVSIYEIAKNNGFSGTKDDFNAAFGSVCLVDSSPTKDSLHTVTSGSVYTALATKADKATTLSGYGIVDAYTQSEVTSFLNTKQNALTFDSAPTANSINPVTSSGIKGAIDLLSANIDHLNVQTIINVPAAKWIADTDDSRYAYANTITVHHIYKNSPIIALSSSDGTALPTDAEIDAFNDVKAIKASGTTLKFYAESAQTVDFYVVVEGVD